MSDEAVKEPVIKGPQDLLKLNVNDHTEKKGRLTYLSWAWAWAEALKVDPAVNFQVQEFNGAAYMDVNGTGLVWVTVTLFGKPVTCMLPVMDNNNRPIQTPNAFQVNTAIMRCMTKALALHGLGLYIYAGEDLPEDADVAVNLKPGDAPIRREGAVATDPFDLDPPQPTVRQHPVPMGPVFSEPFATPTPTVTAVQAMDADMQLFVDSMIEYVGLCDTEDGLKSYWKANQPQIDIVKKNYKPVYDAMLRRFTERKEEIRRESSRMAAPDDQQA